MRTICLMLFSALSFVPTCTKKEKPTLPPTVVTAFQVEPKTIPATFEFVGVLKSSHPVQIRSRVEGYLQIIDYEEGSLVKEGDRLFQIDPRLFEASLKKVAESQQQEALYNYQQVVLNAFKEVENALVGLQQAKKSVDVETDRVKVVKEYLQLAWLRYYEGQTDYLVYLDAERQLYRAEISLAKAQGNVYLYLIDLYKALGGGWVLDADTNLQLCMPQS